MCVELNGLFCKGPIHHFPQRKTLRVEMHWLTPPRRFENNVQSVHATAGTSISTCLWYHPATEFVSLRMHRLNEVVNDFLTVAPKSITSQF